MNGIIQQFLPQLKKTESILNKNMLVIGAKKFKVWQVKIQPDPDDQIYAWQVKTQGFKEYSLEQENMKTVCEGGVGFLD